ncbi:TPA: hypothetical protein NGR52_004262 [Vibrio parahaemolyticus]|nr:hypothetical protein [Vibrio parahaemolyticus]
MEIYDVTLDVDSAHEAEEWASGFVFAECETHHSDKPTHSTWVSNVNGVELWYDFGADYYFFAVLED